MTTTSLELSNKLKEAGYPQDASFYWVTQDDREWYLAPKSETAIDRRDEKEYGFPVIASPTADELGEILTSWDNNMRYLGLPTRRSLNRSANVEQVWELPCEDTYQYPAWKKICKTYAELIFSDTEADARAKQWLYLKKENLL